MPDRLTRVNELISKQISEIIKDEIDFEIGALVTVVRAVASPTLEHATVWVSVFPVEKADEALAEINKNIFRIQQILNKKLVMRKVPKIMFKIDLTEERAGRVENIIDSVKES